MMLVGHSDGLVQLRETPRLVEVFGPLLAALVDAEAPAAVAGECDGDVGVPKHVPPMVAALSFHLRGVR